MKNNIMSQPKKIAWLGGYPSHYTCGLHCRLEKLFSDRLRFFYIEDQKNERDARKFEKTMLPDSCEVFSNTDKLRIFHLIKKINEFDPDLIISVGINPRPIWVIVLIYILMKKKICYWADTNIQDIFLSPKWRQFLKRLFFNLYLSKMWRIFYMGSGNRNFYIWATNRDFFNERKMFFPFAHDHNYYKEASAKYQRNDKQPFTILSVGRLVFNKRVDLLIDSVALLPVEMRKNIICNIVGYGIEKESLIQKAIQLDVRDNFNFVGAIPSDKVVDYYISADVFVLLSDTEPCPLVINESMSSGIPVITPYWVGLVSDLVVDGMTGIVLQDNNTETIAKAIIQLYESNDYGKHLGIEGQKHIELMGFNLETALKSFCKLVEDLDIDNEV
jgi:glycosyltransferase involved in cell wall biosynthesis